MSAKHASPLDQFLCNAQKLPSLPGIVVDILESLGNERLDIDTLARKVSNDQAIVVKMMRVANSPFYGLSRQIGSIQEAIAVLGFNNLRSLVLAASLITGFPREHQEFDWRGFWSHSVAAAIAARLLAAETGQHQDFAFTAGLLHDIGRLLLCISAPEDFRKLLSAGYLNEMEEVHHEREKFGFDHMQLGAEMARRWHLPEPICEAIASHHNATTGQAMSDIVYLASLIAAELSHPHLEHLPAPVFSEAQARLGLEAEVTETLFNSIVSQHQTMNEMLNG